MALEPELKEAILNLSAKDRDKLLLRLITKDKKLTKQLQHQLLDGPESLDRKREEVSNTINEHINRIGNYHPPRVFLSNLREWSALISEYASITKDKYGEMELRLFLLEKIQEFGADYLVNLSEKNEKLASYVAGRIKQILPIYHKLHEDFQFDFRERLNNVLSFARSSVVYYYAKELGFPKEV
ncbi:hypothetical protein [Solitalea koreensis]|uniref:Uncharacterized protein n=1 Tax=Solitalea koreensis TaxID=543615 RepID=A0A521BQB7_9SPHI|nr:hypothetical protein [Solitalea koreensis]SMO49337.1 hypothetical protein SAMN06265350_102427 [Solitalea koreensis]